jgi:hypothetical protein
MEEKERLLQRLDEVREKMRAILIDQDAQRDIYPDWTMKEVLAHLIGWDEVTIAALQALGQGSAPETQAVQGVEDYNAKIVASRQSLSFVQTIDEWENTRLRLKELVSEMATEKFSETLVFPWGGSGTVTTMLEGIAWHEEDHADEISALLIK